MQTTVVKQEVGMERDCSVPTLAKIREEIEKDAFADLKKTSLSPAEMKGNLRAYARLMSLEPQNLWRPHLRRLYLFFLVRYRLEKSPFVILERNLKVRACPAVVPALNILRDEISRDPSFFLFLKFQEPETKASVGGDQEAQVKWVVPGTADKNKSKEFLRARCENADKYWQVVKLLNLVDCFPIDLQFAFSPNYEEVQMVVERISDKDEDKEDPEGYDPLLDDHPPPGWRMVRPGITTILYPIMGPGDDDLLPYSTLVEMLSLKDRGRLLRDPHIPEDLKEIALARFAPHKEEAASSDDPMRVEASADKIPAPPVAPQPNATIPTQPKKRLPLWKVVPGDTPGSTVLMPTDSSCEPIGHGSVLTGMRDPLGELSDVLARRSDALPVPHSNQRTLDELHREDPEHLLRMMDSLSTGPTDSFVSAIAQEKKSAHRGIDDELLLCPERLTYLREDLTRMTDRVMRVVVEVERMNVADDEDGLAAWLPSALPSRHQDPFLRNKAPQPVIVLRTEWAVSSDPSTQTLEQFNVVAVLTRTRIFPTKLFRAQMLDTLLQNMPRTRQTEDARAYEAFRIGHEEGENLIADFLELVERSRMVAPPSLTNQPSVQALMESLDSVFNEGSAKVAQGGPAAGPKRRKTVAKA